MRVSAVPVEDLTVNHYKFTRSTHSVRSGQAGLERDSETGLDHTWFRQYSSAQGRWLSPDPLRGDVTNPQSLNRYAYVNNYPVNSTDPSGLFIAPLTYTLFRSAGAAFYYPGGLTFGVSGCTLDGLDSPCSLVVHAILAGATDVRPESVVQTGSNTFQVWIPGGCVSASDNLGNTLSPSCDEGYWATLTVQGRSGAGLLGSLQDLAKRSPIAASVVVPLFGGIAGPAFSFAFIPETQQFCAGGGLGAVIPASKVASTGPLAFGDVGNAPGILRGTNVSVNAQVDTGRGVQYVWSPLNPSGSLAGPSAATSPGASIAVTYSWCTSLK